MHIYFSGIGGAGIGPLALIAKQAGYEVSGSDKQDSSYLAYLRGHGVDDVHIGQSAEQIDEVYKRSPIDWYVYSAAVAMEQPNAPELVFCRERGIRMTMRDELLNRILQEKHLKLIAVAGTHGKTTTTAMMIWLLKGLQLPVSYSVGAKLSFGDMGQYDSNSEYFIYEADEFARNFLSFRPYISVITGIDWDHADIYPSREKYQDAFKQFLEQSKQAVLWRDDVTRLSLAPTPGNHLILDDHDARINDSLHLRGAVNRQDAWEVANTGALLFDRPLDELLKIVDRFPGVSRRNEEIIPGLYTDYAHTPPKIAGALQLAHEIAGNNVVVVYEGLHNTRQHFIKDDLAHLFDSAKKVYIVPSYLAREDPTLPLLSPDDLKQLLSKDAQTKTSSAELDVDLKKTISDHLKEGDTVLCLTAGGGHSLDEWLRREF